MQSKAKTVSEYLKGLPSDRRAALSTVRNVILKNLPKGYEESMQYGMISYGVSLNRYPAGYLGDPTKPLPYAALGSQKNYMAIYLMNIYGDKKAEVWFRKAFKDAGKKLNMGKSCVRFKKIEDLPLDVIGKAIALTPVATIIKVHDAWRRR